MARRGKHIHDYHNIWSLNSLGQQYTIDVSFRIDRDVADFVRMTQINRRTVLPEEIQKAIKRNLKKDEELGKIIMTNKDIVGSYQWCQMKYQDAIAIALEVKKVRFLITATANPKWEEFQSAMNPDSSTNSMDYADLFNRLFISKDEALKKELVDYHAMGPHLGHARSIEFQKRGVHSFFPI
jgi:hypothetical protein